MDCSSPISANTAENTDRELPSSAGGISPHIAIRVSKPMVFRVTVLPPVLGPVMTRVSKAAPSSTSMGTTFCGSISGWRAWRSRIRPSSVRRGQTAFIL